MSEHCRCGDVIQHVYESWTCAGCHRDCCPACAEREGQLATCVQCRQSGPMASAA